MPENNNYKAFQQTPPHPFPEGRVQNYSQNWRARQALSLGGGFRQGF